MKRIAVVFNGDLSINRQGQLNSAISRIKHLKELGAFDVDEYCIQEYSVGLLRFIRKEKMPNKKPSIIADGVNIKIIYKRCFFISVFLETRCKMKSLLSKLFYWKLTKRFKDYCLISGHSIIGGVVGLAVNKRYGIPYCVTWHGSDIHTLPINNVRTHELVSSIIARSSGNIFVSNSLYRICLDVFGSCPNASIFYNAASDSFFKYDIDKRIELRKKWGVSDCKVVAYVGNLENVKNVMLLPKIFHAVNQKDSGVVFWIIGDGMKRLALEAEMQDREYHSVFWGNQQPENMPDFMNCIDVLVLPSQNESFGMVLVEAISCGANAVGSKRGGIPEVIGEENCFALDDSFVDRISNRIVFMLNNKVKQTVNPEFDWDKTAAKENSLYLKIINTR